MTLKKQLDEISRQSATRDLWREIKDLFLCLDYTELTKGFTFRIFCDSQKHNQCFYIRADDDRGAGKKFFHDYDLETLEAVMPICRENGLNVKRENRTNFLITYKP